MPPSHVRATFGLLAIAACCGACTPTRYPGRTPPQEDDIVRATHAPHGIAHGTVRVASFVSPALGVRKHYEIYLPPSYDRDATRRYPVAYYLHGADGNESDWVSRAAIDWVMDSLEARGAPEMILVMPDGDESWYASSATPANLDDCLEQGRFNEAAALHCAAHASYDAYIARDLVQHIDSSYRTLADRRHRAIGGLSMGGLGALTIALGAPDVFSAVVSHSGVVSLLYDGPHPYAAPARYATSLDSLRAEFGDRLWGEMVATFGDDVAAWRAHDPTERIRRLMAANRPLPAIYFDAGREDRLTIDRNRAFDAELTALGVSHTFREWPGQHSWRFWSEHVGEGLAWLGAHIGS
ncbi:MAG TPA: alpha/beta hydrolase family protein [Gemmatimonadaceae bacterium]